MSSAGAAGPQPRAPRASGPSRSVLLDRDAYLRAWADAHGGHDPRSGGRAERAWFDLVFMLSGRLHRIPPDVLTVSGLALAWAALVAHAGPRWCLLAAAMVVASALLDGVDGAVALRTGRATPWGHLFDSLCDRMAEVAFGLALVGAGAPWPVCLLAVALGWLQEYARARAGASGVTDILVVSIAERPTRVIVVAVGLLAVGVLGTASVGAVDAEILALVAAAAWVGAAVVGLGQVVWVLRGQLLPLGDAAGAGPAGGPHRPNG